MFQPLLWQDRVYGPVAIEDQRLLELIDSPTFQRLKGIRQAGPSALWYPFKTVTRFEHSLGVFELLRRLNADRREQVAGLLHDISHTAFSHAVDFVHASEAQDHHESLKPEFLHRPDLVEPLARLGFEPEEFYHDEIFPLLERPLPWLCADRMDYYLRDSLTCGVSTAESVAATLEHLRVADDVLALDDLRVARDVADRFSQMNRDYWASSAESYIYNEFADALREAFRLGVLSEDHLLGDDASVLGLLKAGESDLIHEKLRNIEDFTSERLESFVPRVTPKERWLDPPVLVAPGQWVVLSSLKPQAGDDRRRPIESGTSKLATLTGRESKRQR